MPSRRRPASSALAFVAYVAQWGFARNVAPDRELVAAGAGARPAPRATTGAERSDMAGGIGFSLTGARLVRPAGRRRRSRAVRRSGCRGATCTSSAAPAILVVLSAYLVLVRVWGIDWVGPIITGFGTVVLGLSALVCVPAGPLVPALHSYWLVIHVLGAMIAGSAFLVGAAASVLFLVKSRAERADA